MSETAGFVWEELLGASVFIVVFGVVTWLWTTLPGWAA